MKEYFQKIIDDKINSKFFYDNEEILTSSSKFQNEIKTSKEAWEKIYNFNLKELKKDREDFDNNKLKDHIRYIEKYYKFTKDTIYLEIGCGPSYIGEYIMQKYNSYFIGVDFNYQMLLILKRYFDEKGYEKYFLIHSDINKMPIKDNSVDFIYGGGVIEHFSDTNHILTESYRILKPNGVSFNTVPAFNLWWILRFYNNIPSLPILKSLFEFIHSKIFKNKILKKYYGYELSYTKPQLINLHKKNGFRNISVEPFAFHPSINKLKNKFLRSLYFKIQKNYLTAAVYLVCGKK